MRSCPEVSRGWGEREREALQQKAASPREEPGPSPAHDVPQLLQVGRGEVPVVPVTPLHILLNPVQVDRVEVQQLRLRGRD